MKGQTVRECAKLHFILFLTYIILHVTYSSQEYIMREYCSSPHTIHWLSFHTSSCNSHTQGHMNKRSWAKWSMCQALSAGHARDDIAPPTFVLCINGKYIRGMVGVANIRVYSTLSMKNTHTHANIHTHTNRLQYPPTYMRSMCDSHYTSWLSIHVHINVHV